MGRAVRAGTRGARLLLALVAAGVAGCAAMRVSDKELPAQPIALLYRNPEQARLRSEGIVAQKEAAGLGRPARRRSKRPGVVVDVDDVTGYLQRVLGLEGRERRENEGRLALLDPLTGRVQPVPAALRGSWPHAWSPDHKRLLFSQLVGHYPQLFEFDRELGTVRPITSGPAAHPGGCYGPEGRLILMAVEVHRRPPVSRLLITEPGGGRPRPLTRGPQNYDPACAPDGSAVAYVARPEHGSERIVVRKPVMGGRPRVLGPGRDPTFSPSSEWIAYSAPVKKEWKLWRVRPDGTGRAPIGRGSFDEQFPTVSPDGRLVVYVAGQAEEQHLYVRRFDGTGDRILFSNGDGLHPVW